MKRHLFVLLLLLSPGCGDGDSDEAMLESTPDTGTSSLERASTTSTTSMTSTTSTSVATTTTWPAQHQACAPEPAERVDPPATSVIEAWGAPQEVPPYGRLVVGDGQLWIHHTDAPADLYQPASAGMDAARALVSFVPACRTHFLQGGPELMAMTCQDVTFGTFLRGPCWVTRHDPATGALLESYGPYEDVVDAQWAGEEVILRTPTGLQAPDLEWEVNGSFATAPAWGIDGAVFQLNTDDTLSRFDLAGGPTVDRPLDPTTERVLGVRREGVLVERKLTEAPMTYELAVWDVLTLEETASRPISGPSELLPTGELVVQRAVVDGSPGPEPFTTEVSLYDIATGEETLVATFEQSLPHRATFPTVEPVVVDGVLIVGDQAIPLR